MGFSLGARARSSGPASSSDCATSSADSSRTARGRRPLRLSLEREPTEIMDALDALRWYSIEPRRDDRSNDSVLELALSRPEFEDEDDDMLDRWCGRGASLLLLLVLLLFFFLLLDWWCEDDDLTATICIGCMAAARACNGALCSLPIDGADRDAAAVEHRGVHYCMRHSTAELLWVEKEAHVSMLGGHRFGLEWPRFSLAIVMGTVARFDGFGGN